MHLIDFQSFIRKLRKQFWQIDRRQIRIGTIGIGCSDNPMHGCPGRVAFLDRESLVTVAMGVGVECGAGVWRF